MIQLKSKVMQRNTSNACTQHGTQAWLAKGLSVVAKVTRYSDAKTIGIKGDNQSGAKEDFIPRNTLTRGRPWIIV